jgi:hypothetical protein
VRLEASSIFQSLLLLTTASSHVFCIDCSNRCQLSGQREGGRPSCPACHVSLTNPDDVVVTNLNPTEDYKTSVLSGLHPNIIMECAGRALSFWAYQSTQEMLDSRAMSFCALLTVVQHLPRILGEELDGQIRIFEHTDGQDHP